jgi:hypothetical protein
MVGISVRTFEIEAAEMKKALLLLAPMVALFATPAAAEVQACKVITSVPFTINKAGVWCLKKKLKHKGTTGYAIQINRNNVVLDLNGHLLFSKGGPSSTAYGIYANNKSNITIRNGIVSGFDRGIYLEDSGGSSHGNVVENIRAAGNYFTGIQVSGESHIVRKNQVVETGDGENSFNAYGIYLNQARGAHVYDNTVTKTSETTNARGIVVIGGQEIVIKNNVVTDLRTATARYGIHVQSADTVSVYGNQIMSLNSTTGIRATGSNDILCLNNVIYGFNNTHSTCDSFVGTLP